MELSEHGASRRDLGRQRAQAVGPNDLKPNLTRTFKLPNDLHFEVKFWDVIGLYFDPSDKA